MKLFFHSIFPIKTLRNTLLLTGMILSFSSAVASSPDEGSVMIIPLRQQIEKSLLYFMRRAFQQAEATPSLKAIIIDMDTPGGVLRDTEEIIAWMRKLNAKVPIYTFINTRAQSAGAIISIASDEIFMAPGSRIGSATPILIAPGGGIQDVPDDVKEKILSDTRSLVRGIAQEKGYMPELAVAMVDRSVRIQIGDRVICEEGQILNLTAKEAVEIIPPRNKPLLATKIVADISELLETKNLSHLHLIVMRPLGAEKLARWITMLSPFLMAAAFIGIYLEIKTPGFGVPGIIGVSCLLLFLFGHYVAGLAGKEDIFLILLGIILLAVEIFIIPGFGIAGILGIIGLIVGMILAMLPHIPSDPSLPTLTFPMRTFFDRALFNLSAAIALTMIGVYFLWKLLPHTPLYSHLVLQASSKSQDGFVGIDVVGNEKLIGKTGKTVTPLRPSGMIMIAGERIDVVSNGEYIDSGESVMVTEANGPRIVVERSNEEDFPPEKA